MGLRSQPGAALAALTAVVCLTAAPGARAQQNAYAVGNGGSTLINFRTDNPGAAVAVGNFIVDGGAVTLDALDFRPLTQELFGYSDATDTLYRVDRTNGALTVVASSAGTAGETNTNILDIDFNPTIDRMRVVTDTDQNIVYNPNAATAATVATNLFYGAGDPNEGINPLIVGNAYNNNVAGLGLGTTQFVIDYGLDSLATLANNAGTLTTVGALGLDVDTFSGFDIFTAGAGGNSAFALFNGGTSPALFRVDLTSGAATSVGALGGSFGQVRGLAIITAAAPEPGTAPLVAGGALLGAFLGALPLATARRRRQTCLRAH